MGLLSSFLGKDQRKDLQAANTQATAEVKQGYDIGDTHYAAAENYFSPYAQEGQRGIEDQNYYRKLLMGDPEAVGKFSSNPLFSGELGGNFMAAQRAGNAAGWGAGKEALAGQRVFGQTAGSWLDRFRGLGESGVNTGLNATNAQAGLRQGRGDMAVGRGTTLAGNTINFGNAMAQNRNTGINNLMGLASTAISGVNAFNKPKV
jgi:hypothetical protein